MQPKVRGWLVSGAALVALVGATVTVVYFFQPWRSCDYEDTSAGCAMLTGDATVMAVAAFTTLAAVFVFVFGLLAKERPPLSSAP
ncbi:hypothetical protein RZO50_14365 [Microbacterium sp. SSW1-59]|uniref:hypothetical protein n=1 Tax=Microbacterium xanthum TaxID=3079794 RepID=UPI002AD3BB70|nr:hypothetical protein [Microbacterium sp. SSW1-59]MDZ8202702.1 hypothetical protein [Microbacterium sp. SSW1-59]